MYVSLTVDIWYVSQRLTHSRGLWLEDVPEHSSGGQSRPQLTIHCNGL